MVFNIKWLIFVDYNMQSVKKMAYVQHNLKFT